MRIKSCRRCLGCIGTIGPRRVQLQRSPLQQQQQRNICRARRRMWILHYCIHCAGEGQTECVCEGKRDAANGNMVLTSQRICFVPMTNGLSNQRNCNASRPRRGERIRPIQYFSEGRLLGWFFFNISGLSLRSVCLPQFRILKNKSPPESINIFQYAQHCSNIFIEYPILL